MSDKYATVPITSDVQKLWSCESVKANHIRHPGKLPPCAGVLIRICVSRAEKSPFCDADAAWPVHPDDAKMIFPEGSAPEYKVCSHQVDCD